MTRNPFLKAVAVVLLCLSAFPAYGDEASRTIVQAEKTATGGGSTENAGFFAGKLVKPTQDGFAKFDLPTERASGYQVLYFSAHWCPACKKVTPRLVEFYEEQRKKHANFEFVFVSSDRSEQEMLQYMNGYRMPWAALRYGEKIEDESILKIAGRGIPCVVVLDAKGTVVTSSFVDGKYQGPMKPVEMLARILDDERAQRALAATR